MAIYYVDPTAPDDNGAGSEADPFRTLGKASNVVNAGIYIFKPEVFELFSGVSSLEKGLFPKLARIKQLVGFFTHGEYVHFG